MGIILFKKYNVGQTSFGSQSYIPEFVFYTLKYLLALLFSFHGVRPVLLAPHITASAVI